MCVCDFHCSIWHDSVGDFFRGGRRGLGVSSPTGQHAVRETIAHKEERGNNHNSHPGHPTTGLLAPGGGAASRKTWRSDHVTSRDPILLFLLSEVKKKTQVPGETVRKKDTNGDDGKHVVFFIFASDACGDAGTGFTAFGNEIFFGHRNHGRRTHEEEGGEQVGVDCLDYRGGSDRVVLSVPMAGHQGVQDGIRRGRNHGEEEKLRVFHLQRPRRSG